MVWDEPGQKFLVVMNGEGQYSIWPDFKDIPEGWERSGFIGNKEDCLHHIDQVWTDMRPRSLRLAMGEHDSADSAA